MIKGDYLKKEPFIINVTDKQLPNLSTDNNDSFGYEFSHTDVWQDTNEDIIKVLDSINKKMDMIIRYIAKNGRD